MVALGRNLNLSQLRGGGLDDSGVNPNPDPSLGSPGGSGDSGAKRARARALVAELARAVWEVPDRWPIGNRLLEHFDRGDGKETMAILDALCVDGALGPSCPAERGLSIASLAREVRAAFLGTSWDTADGATAGRGAEVAEAANEAPGSEAGRGANCERGTW